MRDDRLYRTVWRWHFFAGLIVVPVLAWMAVTGGLYLYKAELERLLFPRLVLAPAPGSTLPVGEIIRRAEDQLHAPIGQVGKPANEGESWRLATSPPGGTGQLAFVRPDNGKLLGVSRAGGPLDLIRELHSLSVAGPLGNVLIEIAAGWAIIMVLTGIYLWWPGAGSRALSLAGRIGERRFWRNLHASSGALAALVILFLALTGMPWTIYWGSKFHAFVAREQIGRPVSPSLPAEAHHRDGHLPWSLQGTGAPMVAAGGDVGPDRALAVATARGLKAPWVLDLPTRPAEPYRIATAAERTQEVRLIYVDPRNAAVLQDIGFGDFGIGAKAFEWGIYTHQGHQYGEINRLVMLAGCIGALLLALSSPIMWWKRRRGPGLSAPPRGEGSARSRGALMLMLTLGLLFPLTGLTMVAALVAGLFAERRRRRAA